jgi:hypothetical protein
MIRRFIGRKFSPAELERPEYLGNAIVDALVINHDWYSVDRDAIRALPETLYYKNLPEREAYQKFYFETSLDAQVILENNGGVLYLHNSWTPETYRLLGREAFLARNTTLANILKKCLEL